jgi:nitroimidazol reductase NimA-like FMN-containing flavoprotein (pyridoxamine 5'-phosphate oxidase superfamily)
MKALPPDVKAYLEAASVCRIASVTEDGEPHLIPVCPVFDGDSTVYVDLGEKSRTARALSHIGRVAVLFDDYFDDWSRLRKVILRCSAEPVTGPEQDEAWNRIREKFPQHTVVDWKPRLTVALRIYAWLSDGFETST